MTKKLTLLVAIVAATIISCQNLEQDTYLTVEKIHIEFSAEGEVKTIRLNTNADPTVITVPEWVSYKLQNSSNEIWNVVLQCMANTSGETRTGILQVRSGKVNKYVSLSQSTCKTDIQDSTEDNTPPAELGVAADIISMHNKKCLYSITQNDQEITMTYLENWTEGKTPTSADFKTATVAKNLIKKFTDNNSSVTFLFNSGTSSTVYVAEMTPAVSLSKESINSNLYDLEKYAYTVDTIDFTIMCPRPELTEIKITGEGGYGSFDVRINSDLDKEKLIGTAYITANTAPVYWQFSIKNKTLNSSQNIKIYCTYERNYLGITKAELREALVALYNNCNGKNWVRQKNWLSDKDVSEWEGVDIRTSNYETFGNIKIPVRTFVLSLYDNNLSGIIPEKFWFACNWCVELDLDGNNLDGSIMPKEAWSKYLNSLHLTSTNIALSLDDAINSPDVGHMVLYGTKCTAPSAAFFNASFRYLRRLGVDFEKPSPLPDNVINFGTNAPGLIRMFINNVTTYPKNIIELPQVCELAINGKLLINKPYDGSIFG